MIMDEGNLCRCGTYARIIDAIQEASAEMRGGKAR
jgi:aerobic-type carbon monoxide dehydrogenase small subunit (CoxS/CutS family)